MNREELHNRFIRLCDEHTEVHEEFMACHFWQIRKSSRLFGRSNRIMEEIWAVWDEINPGPFSLKTHE